MDCNPGDDSTAAVVSDREWNTVLAYRRFESPGALESAAERLSAAGLRPADVRPHLADAGDALYAAAASGEPGWADRFGGARAAALLAAEVSALMSHLVARAAGVRALSVNELLDEYSAVTVAQELGVARQKVYQIARGGRDSRFIETTPWRMT